MPSCRLLVRGCHGFRPPRRATGAALLPAAGGLWCALWVWCIGEEWSVGGAGSRSAALAMTFKLIESAQEHWRAVNAPHLVALVRAGARFKRGVLVEREDASAA